MGDEAELATMHIQSWKETYITPESPLTEEMVDEMLGHMLTDTTFRKNTIQESLKNPEEVLYKVVKSGDGRVVGFMHCTKKEAYNELEGIYLLDEVKGAGVGGELMEEFLGWSDARKPCHLSVLAFNDSALGFYKKYGFVQTDKPAWLYKDLLPVIEMVRPAEQN